jgi:hypothetical protein
LLAHCNTQIPFFGVYGNSAGSEDSSGEPMASEYSLDHLSYWTNLIGGSGFVNFAVSRRVAKLGHSVQLSAWSVQVVQKSL